MSNSTAPEQLLRAIEDNMNAIDFWPEWSEPHRSNSEALTATWVCPFTDAEVSSAVEWHTDSTSVSEWLEASRDYEPAEGENWSDNDWSDAKESMSEESGGRLLVELRFAVSNHLRRMLGMVENRKAWADKPARDQPSLL